MTANVPTDKGYKRWGAASIASLPAMSKANSPRHYGQTAPLPAKSRLRPPIDLFHHRLTAKEEIDKCT